ncbi:MAG: glycosyltransferase [Bacteroidota bacterium]
MVSVLLPVYNAEKYLQQALSSIISQSYSNLELIAVNDGSTDNSLRILRSCNDDRLKIIDQSNQGVARTLNNALACAKGKYIWRHDADDISEPYQLEKQVTFLESNNQFALASVQIIFMTERGKIAYKYRQPKNYYLEGREYKEVFLEHFNPYSPITHATVLVRRNVMDELGGYRVEFKTSEDTDLWLRLLEKNRAVVLNFCSYYVRLSPFSATSRYEGTTNYYRDLAFKYYEERKLIGSDPIIRDEEIELLDSENKLLSHAAGCWLRDDLLSYKYLININARDFLGTTEIIYHSIKDGWKLKQTWKAIVLPLLPKSLVALGLTFSKRSTGSSI